MEPAYNTSAEDSKAVELQGTCVVQFEPVRAAFERHFEEYDEVGASVGVTLRGESVVDLWGGWRDAAKTRPWQRDSVACQWAVSKSVNAMCFGMLIDRGLASYDDEVSRYWPAFAAAGKGRVTIAMLLAHQTGVTGFATAAVTEDFYAGDVSALRLAGQAPFWEPGQIAGYHPISVGILANALFRRIDGRSIQQFVVAELAQPFGLDLSVGAPPDRPGTAAEMIPVPGGSRLFPEDTPARRAANNPPFDSAMANTPVFGAPDLCAVNGYSNGRSMAELYSLFMGDRSDGRVLVSRDVFKRATALRAEGVDVVRGSYLRWTAGFQLNVNGLFGPNPEVVLHTGMGGAFTLADPNAGVTLSYVPNRMGNLFDREPRRLGLVKALYESL
jgi:CubicO group peptidase (beta-lactamase class C family)